MGLGNTEALGFGVGEHQNSGDGDSDLCSLRDTETLGTGGHLGVGDTHLWSWGSLLSPSTGDECPQSLGVPWLWGCSDECPHSLGVPRLWGHVWLWGVPGSLLLPRAGDCPLSRGDTRLCVPRDEGLSVAIELRGFGDSHSFGDSHVLLSRPLLLPRALGNPPILGFGVDPPWSRGFSPLLGPGDSCPQSLGDTRLLRFGDSHPLSLGDIQVLLGFGDPRVGSPRPVLLRRCALVCPLALGTPLRCPRGSAGGWGAARTCREGTRVRNGVGVTPPAPGDTPLRMGWG